jgi:hypothetical protein
MSPHVVLVRVQPSIAMNNVNLGARSDMAAAEVQSGLVGMQQVAVTLRQLQVMQVRYPRAKFLIGC